MRFFSVAALALLASQTEAVRLSQHNHAAAKNAMQSGAKWRWPWQSAEEEVPEPAPMEEPVVEEAPVEEEATEEEPAPVEEEPAPEPAPAEEEVVEEAPVEEEAEEEAAVEVAE